MFLSTLTNHIAINAIKFFLKTNIHWSKYQILVVQTFLDNFGHYGQWVKVVGGGVSYSFEGLGMMMFTCLHLTVPLSPGQSLGETLGSSEKFIFKTAYTLTHIAFSL